jgi:hypothetical protein
MSVNSLFLSFRCLCVSTAAAASPRDKKRHTYCTSKFSSRINRTNTKKKKMTYLQLWNDSCEEIRTISLKKLGVIRNEGLRKMSWLSFESVLLHVECTSASIRPSSKHVLCVTVRHAQFYKWGHLETTRISKTKRLRTCCTSITLPICFFFKVSYFGKAHSQISFHHVKISPVHSEFLQMQARQTMYV